MSRKKIIFLICFFVFVCLSGNQAIAAQLPDRPSDQQYLFDFAKLVQSREDTIKAMSKEYEASTGIEFVVVTLNNLQGLPINEYAVQLFEKWKIGEKTQDNGLLLILAKKELLVKMEVAYELEDVFTDAFCSYIEREQLLPYLEAGDVGSGLQGTIEAVINQTWDKIDSGVLALPKKETLAIKPDVAVSGGAGAKKEVAIGTGARKYVYLDDSLREKYSAQSTPEDAFLRVLEALENKITDPTLGIYSEGTQILHINSPPGNTFQFNTFVKLIKEGYPYKIITEGNLAVIKFRDGAIRSSPLLFRLSSKGWQFDEASTWRIFHFDYNNNWYMKAKDHDFMFAFGDRRDENGYRDRSFKISRELKPSLREEISYYEKEIEQNPNNYLPYMQLAELYFYDCWLWQKALKLYEDGLSHMLATKEKALANFYIASQYLFCAKYDLAASHYKEYVKFFPDYYYGYFCVGNCYLQKRQAKEAIKYFNKSWKLEKGIKNADSIVSLGYAYALLKDFWRANNCLKTAEKIGVNSERLNKLKFFIQQQKRR